MNFNAFIFSTFLYALCIAFTLRSLGSADAEIVWQFPLLSLNYNHVILLPKIRFGKNDLFACLQFLCRDETLWGFDNPKRAVL